MEKISETIKLKEFRPEGKLPSSLADLPKNSKDMVKDIEKLYSDLATRVNWFLVRFSGVTNYIEITSKGVQTFYGTARVTVDMYITASGVKAPGSHPATFAEYGLCGVWRFADQGVAGNQEQISGTLKLPTQIDITVVPIFKIGWSANGVSPGNCEWQLEYLYRSPNEDTTAAAQETLTAIGTASATSDGLIVTAFSGLDLPSASDQAMFFRITRLSAGGNDTIADDVEVRGMLFTHTRNKLGTAVS